MIMKNCSITRSCVLCHFYQVARNFLNSINEITDLLEVREYNFSYLGQKNKKGLWASYEVLSPVHIIVFYAQHAINLPKRSGK